jgi:hypothetical protein
MAVMFGVYRWQALAPALSVSKMLAFDPANGSRNNENPKPETDRLNIKKSDFFILIALTGGLAILSSTMSKTPVLPLFAQALGASPTEIGWIVVASTIPGILVSFPVARCRIFWASAA